MKIEDTVALVTGGDQLLRVLRMSKASAPTLAANEDGAILNVLSIASWFNSSRLAAYAASKAAAWSLTNWLRYELAPQKTQVLALHMSFVDADLVSAIDAPKSRFRATNPEASLLMAPLRRKGSGSTPVFSS